MRNPITRLYIVFFTFVANLVVIPLVGTYAMHLVWYPILTLFVVMLPMYILCSKDALEFISFFSTVSSPRKAFVWLIACLPVFTFGILGSVIGAGIILWVLYNVFVERQPEFIVPALVGGFGMGPAILIFGLYFLESLWVRRKNN